MTVEVAVLQWTTVAVAGEREMEKSDAGAAVMTTGLLPDAEEENVVAPP